MKKRTLRQHCLAIPNSPDLGLEHPQCRIRLSFRVPVATLMIPIPAVTFQASCKEEVDAASRNPFPKALSFVHLRELGAREEMQGKVL